jgi:hypothetical protein
MPIKIKPSEQALIDLIAADANTANDSGIQVQPAANYADTVYPVPNYAGLLSANPGLDDKVLDGSRGLLAPIVRRMGPVFGQASNTNPSFNLDSSYASLLTLTLSENLEVPRNVEVSASGTCMSDDDFTRFGFRIDVNGIDYTEFKQYFFEKNVHQAFASTWIVTLPAGAVTITLEGRRAAGPGEIIFNASDYINITFRG